MTFCDVIVLENKHHKNVFKCPFPMQCQQKLEDNLDFFPEIKKVNISECYGFFLDSVLDHFLICKRGVAPPKMLPVWGRQNNHQFR